MGHPYCINSLYSETTEALKHVTEEEKLKRNELEAQAAAGKPKKQPVGRPTIDRERSLNITYAIASPEKLDAVNNLLYASYHPDEPITKHLGLYKGPGSIPDADKRVEHSIQRNLSL